MPSNVNAVLDKILENIRASQAGRFFEAFERKEFPYCEAFPAIHVNASDALDDTNQFGMGQRQRNVRVLVYVTLLPYSSSDPNELEQDIWDVVDQVRDVIFADKWLGEPNPASGSSTNLLHMPIIRADVRSVPSPIGVPWTNCRRIEFDAMIRETVSNP